MMFAILVNIYPYLLCHLICQSARNVYASAMTVKFWDLHAKGEHMSAISLSALQRWTQGCRIIICMPNVNTGMPYHMHAKGEHRAAVSLSAYQRWTQGCHIIICIPNLNTGMPYHYLHTTGEHRAAVSLSAYQRWTQRCCIIICIPLVNTWLTYYYLHAKGEHRAAVSLPDEGFYLVISFSLKHDKNNTCIIKDVERWKYYCILFLTEVNMDQCNSNTHFTE